MSAHPGDDEAERAVREAVAAELRLLEPAVRASPTLVTELLHPDFHEFGASGRRWDRVSVLSVTSYGTGARTAVREMSGTLLAPGVVHLTYVSDTGGRRARRSSVWRLTEAGWRLYFHQGTPSDGA